MNRTLGILAGILAVLAAAYGIAFHTYGDPPVDPAWQLRGLDIEDPAKCLQLFRANRDTGIIPLLFFCAALFV